MTARAATFMTDLTGYAASNSLGSVGTSIFDGQLPAITTPALLFAEYGGAPGDRARGVDPVNVQVTSRALDYATARSLIYAAYSLLNEPSSEVTAGSSRWTYCKALQLPTPLGIDEQQQTRFVCNFRFTLQR